MDVSTDGADSEEEDEDFVQTDSDAEHGTSRGRGSKALPSGSSKPSSRPRRAASNSIVVDLTMDDNSDDEIRSPVRRRPPSSVKPAAGKPEPGHVQTEALAAAAQAQPMQVGLMLCAQSNWHGHHLLHALDANAGCDPLLRMALCLMGKLCTFKYMLLDSPSSDILKL